MPVLTDRSAYASQPAAVMGSSGRVTKVATTETYRLETDAAPPAPWKAAETVFSNRARPAMTATRTTRMPVLTDRAAYVCRRDAATGSYRRVSRPAMMETTWTATAASATAAVQTRSAAMAFLNVGKHATTETLQMETAAVRTAHQNDPRQTAVAVSPNRRTGLFFHSTFPRFLLPSSHAPMIRDRRSKTITG